MTDERGKNSWYVRRGVEVSGPYAAGLISRFLLLGRVRLRDEVSHDGHEWEPISAHPGLIPDVLRHVVTKEDKERLLLARRHADERAHDRRGARSGGGHEAQRRRSGDRRSPEDEETLAYRDQAVQQLEEGFGAERPPYVAGLVTLVAVLAALLLFWRYGNPPPRPVADCNAPAVPGVDWSNCHMEGLRAQRIDLNGIHLRNAHLEGAKLTGSKFVGGDLAYTNFSLADLSYCDLADADLMGAYLAGANLTNASLRGANLAYANLNGADIGLADLTGAKLGRAIWIDGRTCAPDSVGSCKLPGAGTAAPAPQ